jgi:hypothetical protein
VRFKAHLVHCGNLEIIMFVTRYLLFLLPFPGGEFKGNARPGNNRFNYTRIRARGWRGAVTTGAKDIQLHLSKGSVNAGSLN